MRNKKEETQKVSTQLGPGEKESQQREGRVVLLTKLLDAANMTEKQSWVIRRNEKEEESKTKELVDGVGRKEEDRLVRKKG